VDSKAEKNKTFRLVQSQQGANRRHAVISNISNR